MTTPVGDSPESAAIEGFPPAHCRVVASRVHGDAAYVLLDTGPVEYPYLYGVSCVRRDGRWTEGTSGNGPGWSAIGDDFGTLTIWGEAPPRADRVRVEYRNVAHEEPVQRGVYLAAWWNVPDFDDDAWPRVEAFRIDGQWVDVTERC